MREERDRGRVKISREWAMPNSHTFSIPPIEALIHKYIEGDEERREGERSESESERREKGGVIIDPFANESKLAGITNDLDTRYDTTYHLDAIDFLKLFKDGEVDVVLYDPPYSPRQVAECYKKLGRSVDMQTTQSSYWSEQKREISRIVKTGGIVITCGWNSGGIGKTYGFEIQEILLVPHGGWHNDTIVVVDKKIK